MARQEYFVLTARVETFNLALTVRKTLGDKGDIVERWEGFGWRQIGLNCLTIFILWTGVWEGQADGPFNLRINMELQKRMRVLKTFLGA